MEHVIVTQLWKHLEVNSILTSNQFGFVTVDDIARAINNELQVDTVVLDFSKAFNKVTYSRLVHKLEYYGVRWRLLIWFESILNNQTQQVVVENEFSRSREVLSGVR